MRCFENIAKLIRDKRTSHPKGYSQADLSHLLGYKNGQFISNVERALCSIPLKMLGKISRVLDIPSEELKVAMLKDHEITLNAYINAEEQPVKPRQRRKDVQTGHVLSDEEIQKQRAA